MGDPLFVPGMAEYEKDILEQSTVDEIRGKISDTHTLDVSAYDPAGIENRDTYESQNWRYDREYPANRFQDQELPILPQVIIPALLSR